MSLKDDVLDALSNKQDFISGQQLANQLGVSRNAIWKAINSLKDQGYEFESVTNLGYKLSHTGDVLTNRGVEKFLDEKERFEIHILSEASSTNSMLKELAENGEQQGLVLATTYQVAGRGRGKRSFYSPKDKGIYFSLLLNPKIEPQKAIDITLIAGVSLVKAIKDVTNIDTQIKWVNDVYYKDKKIAGILSEASLSFENGEMRYVVVGLGLNLIEPVGGYPKEIRDVAGALFESAPNIPDLRNRLIAKTLNYILYYVDNIDKREYVNEYKKLQWLTNKNVQIIRSDKVVGVGRVIGLDNECHLLVQHTDGEIEHLSSGEVRVRIK